MDAPSAAVSPLLSALFPSGHDSEGAVLPDLDDVDITDLRDIDRLFNKHFRTATAASPPSGGAVGADATGPLRSPAKYQHDRETAQERAVLNGRWGVRRRRLLLGLYDMLLSMRSELARVQALWHSGALYVGGF